MVISPRRILLSLFTFMGSISGKIVVWDLGHVLIAPHTISLAFQHLGISTIIGSSEKDIRRIITDIQNTARLLGPQNSIVMGDKGSPLSNLHCEYLAGMVTSEECFGKLHESIELLNDVGYFQSKRERRLAERVLEVIYNPEICAQYMGPINKGAQLLKKCAEKRNEEGNLCNEMMILSNWDKESFPLMYHNRHNNKIFQHFTPENIIISGSFGHPYGNKPHHWLFNYITKFKQTHQSDFVFIDDQIANVEAARRCGWNAVWLENGNYKKAEQELRQLGVL